MFSLLAEAWFNSKGFSSQKREVLVSEYQKVIEPRSLCTTAMRLYNCSTAEIADIESITTDRSTIVSVHNHELEIKFTCTASVRLSAILQQQQQDAES